MGESSLGREEEEGKKKLRALALSLAAESTPVRGFDSV
jgi:hypothetical protein